jgi:pyruvate/2-oxoglutarate dehydrogenase complex dihydrolipoamide acyltransferase (E2) component
MAQTIIMPQLGETVAEGKILTWFKKQGDEVKEGDKLFEVETDKVTVEVEAIASGKLSEIRVTDGQTAKVGAVVAVIGGETASAKPAAKLHAEAPSAPATTARSPFEEVSTPKENYGSAKAPNGLRVTPLARRLISQNGLDLASLAMAAAARGAKRIAEDDVQRALSERQGAPQIAAATQSRPPTQYMLEGASIPLSAIRQKTADRLAENWRTIPHVFQGIEVDFTAVEQARAKAKERFRAMHGIGLTYLPFIARAVCLAIAEFPNVNARFDGKALFPSADVNLGIAVDLNHNGLVVPVVKNAGDLTVEGIAKAIGRMIEKARAGKLSADDMSGGTYSITNNGAFGTMFTSPIINAPQVAILSTDAIRKRPMIIETSQGDFIASRLTGIVGQSFDHRAFDGAYSAAFLSRLKAIIETRNWSDELAVASA